MKQQLFRCLFVATIFASTLLQAQDSRNASHDLRIAYDADTDSVIVSWTGKGILKQAPDANGKFRPVKVPHGQNYYVAPRGEKRSVYKLVSYSSPPPYSSNIVGYVNVTLPPGLSLIANPLYGQTEEERVGDLWYWAPDGSQILKYVPGVGFEVSTFDGATQGWSNPDLQTPVGQGFYFRNPTDYTVTQTFVGEVRLGYVVNPLPIGFSMKGSLIPQSGSINSTHSIPGEDGDQIRMWINDLQGGGYEEISTFSGEENQWVPDLNLRFAQGFWIYKQRAQNWVRYFNIN
jgi:hypothetical protein